MAASRKSKLSDRLEVQERFRINLESIINKYDKPFEDSPILDLHKMSSVSHSRQELNFFKPFGRTQLATDLQKGKKRRGGVSCDSALGSTISPSKTNESEDSSGNIHLQNYDFTHETSDSLEAFVRYKHLSMSKNPEIVGLKRGDGEYDESSGSDDDLGSVCSGPTSAPYQEEKYTERMRDNEGDMIEVDRTKQTDGDIRLDERSSQDKVRSWLSDDAFMNTSCHSNMDEDSEGDVSITEIEELSQESEYPSTLSEDEQDKAKSLLEIKERFVRRVKSMLVEGNNETDDISSSADETVGFSQRVAIEGTEGQNNIPRTLNVSSGEKDRSSYPDVQNEPRDNTSRLLFKVPLSSTICQEASTARGNQDCYRDKQVMLTGDETTIIAGHFDDDIIMLPECKDEDNAITGGAVVQKGFELVQSPGGKVEWTSSQGRSNLAEKALPFRTHHIKNKIEFQDSSQPSYGLTPKKTILTSDMTERTFKTPRGTCKLPFKSHISKTTSENCESSQGIISEIMDFFKSPLPELLTSPMPILSPKGRLRTAQGKPVTRNAVLKPADTGRTCPSAVSVQGSSPVKSQQSQLSRKLRQSLSPGSPIASEMSSHNSFMIAERTTIDGKSSNFQMNDTLNTSQGPLGIQEIHGEQRSIEQHSIEQSMSTEEEGDISLLTEDSSKESTTFQFQSPSRITNVSQSPKTPTQLSHSTNKLVKVPKTPSQLSFPDNKLETVSKTPSITSPFSRMRVNSAEKDQLKVRHVQEKRVRNNLPHPSKSLLFGEGNLGDSRDSTENRSDMELLVISSSDDDDDDDVEVEYEIKEKANKYKLKMSKDISHNQYSSTKPGQIENKKIFSQENSVEDKSDAKERQGSRYKGNVAVDSLEQLSYGYTEETRASIQACNKSNEFEQTYIISDRRRKTSTLRHMSPSRNKSEKDQQQCKKMEYRSSSHTTQFNLTSTKENDRTSNEPRHMYLRIHKIREEYSSPTKMNSTRTAHVETGPVKTKSNHNSKRHNKEHATNLKRKISGFNRLHKGNDETSKTKDTNVGSQGGRTNDQHSHLGRVSDRSNSTFVSNPGFSSNDPTRKEDGICVDNEDFSSFMPEDSSSVMDENRLLPTPKMKTRLLSNTVRKFDETKDKDKKKSKAKPAIENDSRGSSDVRIKSSKHQKMLIQEDRYSNRMTATKLPVRDVSFLSSTRIDEDGFCSQDLNSSVTSSRLRKEEQRASKKPTKMVPWMYEEAMQEKCSEMKGQTPKRRRQGSDRSNSLESPAKKPTVYNTTRTLDRNSRRMLASSDENIEVKEWNDESLSSICEGPGRCIKKICFKCAMNE